MMLTPPPIARPFGQVDEPVRMVSASSFQKKVGLKISMNGRSATWTGVWAVCAPDGTADAAKVRVAISHEPVDFMTPLYVRPSLFNVQIFLTSRVLFPGGSLSRRGYIRKRPMAATARSRGACGQSRPLPRKTLK